MTKNPTQNDGAAQERAAIKQKIGRMKRAWKNRCNAVAALEELRAWIDTRPVRTAKRKGGLGRK